MNHRLIRAFKFLASRACLCLVASAALTPAMAQTYPERTVRLVSVSSAGTGVDDYSRLLAAYLSQQLGHSFVVENRPGANTIIAADYVAKSPPDGYTLLYGVASTMSANPILFKTLPYSPDRDFVPIARMSAVPNVIVVPAASPYRSMNDLLAAARAQPGKLTAGSGTTGYRVLLAAIHEAAKVSVQDVPYKATTGTVQDLIGGVLDYTILEVSAATPLVQAGRLRALAIAAPVRVPALADVPTLAEAGIPGVTLMSWTALFAPANTAPAIIEKLQRLALEFVSSPQAASHYALRGTLAYPATGAELKKTIAEDRVQWQRLVDVAGIQPQ